VRVVAINADYAWIRHLAYHAALSALLLLLLWLCFCYLSFCRLLFAVWFLFLCGCTFYVHKRISLNTKTTCGNSNNNKAKTHAHTHTQYISHLGGGGGGVCAIDKAMATAKTAKALHLIISQRDSEIERAWKRERESSKENKTTWERRRTKLTKRKRAKRRQKTNTARTAQQNGNLHDFTCASILYIYICTCVRLRVCVCVCVCVFLWLVGWVMISVEAVAVHCYTTMEARTYVFSIWQKLSSKFVAYFLGASFYWATLCTMEKLPILLAIIHSWQLGKLTNILISRNR